MLNHEESSMESNCATQLDEGLVNGHRFRVLATDFEGLSPYYQLQDNAVLLLWVTPLKMKEALDAMEAGGYSYGGHGILPVKDESEAGGYAPEGHGILPVKDESPDRWFKTEHYVLLLGVKGNVPPTRFPMPSIIKNEGSRREIGLLLAATLWSGQGPLMGLSRGRCDGSLYQR